MADRFLYRTFIREWRQHRGLSLEALASAACMQKSNLSKVERGINPYTQEKLELIAKRLNCTPADLLGRAPDESRALEMMLHSATPEQRAQLFAVAEALLKWNPGPRDPTADLVEQTREIAGRHKPAKPAAKRKAAG